MSCVCAILQRGLELIFRASESALSPAGHFFRLQTFAAKRKLMHPLKSFCSSSLTYWLCVTLLLWFLKKTASLNHRSLFFHLSKTHPGHSFQRAAQLLSRKASFSCRSTRSCSVLDLRHISNRVEECSHTVLRCCVWSLNFSCNLQVQDQLFGSEDTGRQGLTESSEGLLLQFEYYL